MARPFLFRTPDGAEWQYSSEFNGYWVMFERTDGTKWVSGSREPLRELSDATLIEALRELWQRRRTFHAKR
jgi:hypothetical protein